MSKIEDIQRLVALAKMAEELEDRIQLGASVEATEYWTEQQGYYLRQAEQQVLIINAGVMQSSGDSNGNMGDAANQSVIDQRERNS